MKPFHNCDRSVALLMFIMAAAASTIAVSNQSIWIDEAYTAGKAMQDSLSGWWQEMQLHKGSDIQMPLYMLSIWAWEKIFGHSEFALRAMNIPLFLVAIGCVLCGLRLSRSIRVFFVLFACTSAFVWAYLDEARPYMMQFSAATLAMVSLVNLACPTERFRTTDLVLFALGILLLCGSSLIGVVYSFFFGLALLALWNQQEKFRTILLRRDLWMVAAAAGVTLVGLGAYYVWTLSLGAKASDIGKTNIFTLGFAFYEMLGLAGLGPGRNDLRENPIAALAPYWATLFISVLIVLLFIFSSFIAVFKDRCFTAHLRRSWSQSVLTIAIAVLAAGGAIFLIGIFKDFRVVGRHLMPVFPFVLLIFSFAATIGWNSKKMVHRVSTLLLLAAGTTSALTFRFSPDHAKDDYRTAAARARESLDQGGTVWWAADTAAAIYYGLRVASPAKFQTNVADSPANSSAIIVTAIDMGLISLIQQPDLVVYSKTDIYDQSGSLRRFLDKSSYTAIEKCPAFTFWAQEQKSLNSF